MSAIFYDHIISLGWLDKQIKNRVSSSEEKYELWLLVEEIVHHKVLGCCLKHLSKKDHREFLEKFMTHPYNKDLIKYIEKKAGKNIEKIIKNEVKEIIKELGLMFKNKYK